MDWENVTNVEELHEYIEEHIGWEHVYDEMYEDFLYGMMRNRESKRRLEKLFRESDSESIMIQP